MIAGIGILWQELEKKWSGATVPEITKTVMKSHFRPSDIAEVFVPTCHGIKDILSSSLDPPVAASSLATQVGENIQTVQLHYLTGTVIETEADVAVVELGNNLAASKAWKGALAAIAEVDLDDPDLDHLIQPKLSKTTSTTMLTEDVLVENEGPAMITRSAKRMVMEDNEKDSEEPAVPEGAAERPSKRIRKHPQAGKSTAAAPQTRGNSAKKAAQVPQTAGTTVKGKGKSASQGQRRGEATTARGGALKGRGRGRGR